MGTVAYTDPYSADTDGDGKTDFDELGGLPQKLLWYSKGHEFVTTINYQKSDANDAESTGKKLTPGYMIVDDFNYLPYDKENYERIFVLNTGEVDENGEAIYGLYNVFNSNPDEISWNKRMNIMAEVMLQEKMLKRGELLGIEILPNARENLMRYIFNKEDRYIYNCEEALQDSQIARDIWAKDVYNLMVAAETYLEENQSAIITPTPENQVMGIEFEFWSDMNWNLAIHSSKVRSVGNVSYDGDKYTMELKFYIFDYYDWDKTKKIPIGRVSPKDLYQLCRCGNSRFFENWGLFETQFTWEATPKNRELVLKNIKTELKNKGV